MAHSVVYRPYLRQCVFASIDTYNEDVWSSNDSGIRNHFSVHKNEIKALKFNNDVLWLGIIQKLKGIERKACVVFRCSRMQVFQNGDSLDDEIKGEI